MNVKLKGSKVLILCTTDNMIWQFLVPHILDLQSYGARVECACANTGFWFGELEKNLRFKMHEIPFSRGIFSLKNLKASRILKKLIKENQYDLIFCQQSVASFFGRFVAKKLKVPTIYTVHGFAFAEGNNPLKNMMYKTVEKFLAKKTDVLITMNDYDYQICKNWKVSKTFKISGIGIEEKNPSDQITRSSLGLNKEDVVIVSIAEFIKRKNYPTMLKTISELKSKYSNIKYLMCGTGKLLEKMKKLAKKLDILDIVKFLGYRKDVLDILSISDIFYHQSYNEGLTMSIMEAMRQGLPVVTSNRRGNVDLIDHQLGGFITEPNDISSQVTRLSELIDDRNLREKFGKYNQDRVKDYSIDRVRAELKNIYKELDLI